LLFSRHPSPQAEDLLFAFVFALPVLLRPSKTRVISTGAIQPHLESRSGEIRFSTHDSRPAHKPLSLLLSVLCLSSRRDLLLLLLLPVLLHASSRSHPALSRFHPGSCFNPRPPRKSPVSPPAPIIFREIPKQNRMSSPHPNQKLH
jgi:hypothetical protein